MKGWKNLEEPLMTIEDLSIYLSIKKSTLYSKIERGELPFYKIGNLIRFRQSEIGAWLLRAKCEPAEQRPKAKSTVQNNNRDTSHINAIVTKAIADAKKLEYTPNYGKPDRAKGRRKEVGNGSL